MVGWVVGPLPKTHLVCLLLVTGRPPPGILRCTTLLARERGVDGPESANKARIRDIFKVGGRFYGWVGGRTTTRYLNGRPPAPVVTQRRRRRRRRGGRHHPPWRTANDNDKESSDRGQQTMTTTTTAAVAVSNKWDTSMPGVVGDGGRGGRHATMTWRARGHGIVWCN